MPTGLTSLRPIRGVAFGSTERDDVDWNLLVNLKLNDPIDDEISDFVRVIHIYHRHQVNRVRIIRRSGHFECRPRIVSADGILKLINRLPHTQIQGRYSVRGHDRLTSDGRIARRKASVRLTGRAAWTSAIWPRR